MVFLFLFLSSSFMKPILHPSTFIPPVPYFNTFLAIVDSSIGLRATTIGSWAGLSAEPHPSHFLASGDDGAVFSNCFLILQLLGYPLPYNHSIQSLISNPASSITQAIL